MRQVKLLMVIGLLMAGSTMMKAQKEIKLYPAGPAESNGIIAEEEFQRSDFVINIREPRMFYYPATTNPTGAAVVICPGGGYWGVSVIKEGEEIARWFNSKGVSAFVVYYRMPNGHYEIPLKDALTAIELVRSNSKAYGLNKKRIGIMGFSAGGHLAATAGTQYTSKKNKPDFMILGYPVISMKEGVTHGGSRKQLLGDKPAEELVLRFSNELQVTRKTPPAFIFHASDDRAVPLVNSSSFAAALTESKVPNELHVFQKGGHGFGMRPTNPETDQWPVLLEQWLKKRKLIQ